MQNGNIAIKLGGANGVRCNNVDGTDYYITGMDVDVIDGRIYGINFTNTHGFVALYHADDQDADDAEMAKILGHVDIILQMLGLDITFDWSSDSADYDYDASETAPGDVDFVFETDKAEDADTITKLLDLPGATITRL